MNKRIIASLLALLVALSASAAFAENDEDESVAEVTEVTTDSGDDDGDESVIGDEDTLEVEDENVEEIAEYSEEDLLIAPAPDAEKTDGEEADGEETEAEGKTISFTLGENRIILNNDSGSELDVAPCVIDGIVMLPFRAVFEALGAVISWDAETKTIFAIKGETVFVHQVGQAVLYINSDNISLDAPSVIVNDRTLISVDAVSKVYGGNVDYNEEEKTVTITK